MQAVVVRAGLGLGAVALACGCGCTPPCEGGFAWRLEPHTAGRVLPPGDYLLTLEVDEQEVTLRCTASQSCGRYDGRLDTYEIDSEVLVDGFFLRIYDGSGDDLRGPEDVGIVVMHEGSPFARAQYSSIRYAREFYVDGQCEGYCDEREPEFTRW